MQKFGRVLENWVVPVAPNAEILVGTYATLERLNADRHAAQLYQAFTGHDQVWGYLPYGPFHSSAAYHRWVADMAAQQDPYFYAVKSNETGEYLGVTSYLRITPAAGSIEVGHINFSPALQRTPVATDAMYLMMKWAFDNGYRRYEWKCDSLNIPSRRAAQRFGFSYEGIFRQAAVVKRRNRDTAWFAAIDAEWPALNEAYRAWLSPANFDAQGNQRERLGNLTRLVLAATDPAL